MQEITIKYLDEKQEEKENNINIVDTTKPVVEYNKELSTTSGNKIDLLKDVKVTDNSDEDIKTIVEKDYDINISKYVSVDTLINL